MELRSIVKKLLRLFSLHRYYIYNEGIECGLYIGQLPVLEAIKENEFCTQKELADIIRVTPPSIATSIKRMQKAGLVERVKDKKDKRNNLLHLTELGIKVYEDCRKNYDAVDRMMFGDFSESEIEQFHEYITRMVHNLEKDGITDREIYSVMRDNYK